VTPAQFEAQRRASEAKRLLEGEPLLTEAFAALRQTKVNELIASKGLNFWRLFWKRQMLIAEIHALDGLRAQLKSVITIEEQRAKPTFRVA
jgi:hypothetical protein